jgi:phenylalanyl-tRNA synthetase beta chain
VPQAAKRAAQLFATCAGGEVLSGVVEQYPGPIPPQTIELNKSEIRRVLGFDLLDEEVERILNALQFTVQPSLWGWNVTPPPTRLDIQAGAADLIEELARVSGYDRLPETRLAQEMPLPTGNRTLELEQRIRELLADQGVSEAITYSLSSTEAEQKLLGPSQELVVLLNPISPERSVMRRSLLPGLLSVTQSNLEQGAASVALFELGAVYHPHANGLPAEPRRLALALVGRRHAAAWDDTLGVKPPAFDFFDLKAIVEALVADLHLAAASYARTKAVPHLHPGKAAELRLGSQSVGHFGELHPKVAEAFDFKDHAVLVADFDLDAILNAVPSRYPYRPFSTFPPAKRDIAIVVPAETTAAAVQAELVTAGGQLLTRVELFDVYVGDTIPAGTKSLAFALTYQAADRTLGEKEIEKAHDAVERRVRHVLKAKIRGKD